MEKDNNNCLVLDTVACFLATNNQMPMGVDTDMNKQDVASWLGRRCGGIRRPMKMTKTEKPAALAKI